MRTAMIVLALAAAPVAAAQLHPISYDTPNGDFGSYNYWDGTYTGSGQTTVSGAALSGGLGALTDGIIATLPWYSVSNVAGTGQYVGWYQTPDPTIVFHFAGAPVIDRITLHIDAQTGGGVYAPGFIAIDGVAQAYSAGSGPSAIDISGLALTGAQHSIQLGNGPRQFYFMLSEVEFFGAPSTVPEPAAWSLLIAGFALTGTALRRRRLELGVI
jgi:hypothetical protein